MTGFTQKSVGVLRASFAEIYEISYRDNVVKSRKLFSEDDSVYGAAYSSIYSNRGLSYVLPLSYSADDTVTDKVFHIRMYRSKPQTNGKDSIDAGYFLVRDISMLHETSAGGSFTVNTAGVLLRYKIDKEEDLNASKILKSLLLVPSQIAATMQVDGTETAAMFTDPLSKNYDTDDFKKVFRQ